LLDLAGQARLVDGALFVAAHRVADLGQVTGAGRRHHRVLVGAVAHLDHRQTAFGGLHAQLRESGLEGLVKGCHAVVVEARRHGAKHRHLLGGHGPGFLVALHLLGHVAQGV
jgi:hypothetical protein